MYIIIQSATVTGKQIQIKINKRMTKIMKTTWIKKLLNKYSYLLSGEILYRNKLLRLNLNKKCEHCKK